MPLSAQVRILILLCLPALCLPSGVAMSWCLCSGADARCCETEIASCCGHAPSPGETDESGGCDECDDCPSIDSGDLDAVLTTDGPKPPASTPAIGASFLRVAVPPVERAPLVGGRSPPVAWTAPGLLPGVRPLRI